MAYLNRPQRPEQGATPERQPSCVPPGRQEEDFFTFPLKFAGIRIKINKMSIALTTKLCIGLNLTRRFVSKRLLGN